MARAFRPTLFRRLANRVVAPLVRLGLAPGVALLTVRGRRSGRPFTTPVQPITVGGRRYVVAPYGVVGWVRNARAAGEVTLRRGRRRERLAAVEVDPDEAGPVLAAYVRRTRIVRPYFDARPGDPPGAFAAEAARHPVFRLEPPSPASSEGGASR